MADQAINALPTKSSPSTGDKVLMIGTAEEYQILLDDLATAVLDKLTSKSYTLDQGTKTLITALNELNSKSLKNAMGAADHNANNVKTPGVYRVPENGDDIQNHAVELGVLIVLAADNGNMVIQIEISYNASIVKIRTFWWTQWYSWREFTMK